MYVAEKENWIVVPCSDKGEPLPIGQIHKTLKEKIEGLLK